MLFQDGRFQWHRLENLLELAKEGQGGTAENGQLDLSGTITDGARVSGIACAARALVLPVASLTQTPAMELGHPDLGGAIADGARASLGCALWL